MAKNDDLEHQEQSIREDVYSKFPYLTTEAKEAIIQSRLSILKKAKHTVVKADLGTDASKSYKEELFDND